MSNPISATIPVEISTRVLISDVDTGEILVDKSNAIHRQNMARAIARGLAMEPNHYIRRMAFGNGGTFRDAAGNIVFNSPNDGRDGSWESRLYNETYSEIVNSTDPDDIGTDPGSYESGNIRPGGGANPDSDPTSANVLSQEVGTKSNVIVTVYLNNNEPSGQLQYDTDPISDTDCFQFDELGLYSPGAPPASTNGYSGVDTGSANSETVTTLLPNTVYQLPVTVNGTNHTVNLTTPAGGSGPNNAFTYGDICEGINAGTWTDTLRDHLTVYITDRSGGTYPTIIGRQSYGHLIFESKTVGDSSTVDLLYSATPPNNFFYVITSATESRVNSNKTDGVNAGVANDPTVRENERERLLTHLVFDPILKSSNRTLRIEYILTISVAHTTDSQVQIVGP